MNSEDIIKVLMKLQTEKEIELNNHMQNDDTKDILSKQVMALSHAIGAVAALDLVLERSAEE